MRTGARLLATALLAVCAPMTGESATAETPEWKDAYYNPSPAPDDLVMPMPCGGAMTFRWVATPHGESHLDDTLTELGAETADFGHLRGRRWEHVSGPFHDEFGTKGFYIGKYEVAEAQLAVLSSETCPTKRFRRGDFRAAAGVTWLQATTAAEAYSVWLNRNARDSAPGAGEAPVIARLPTEPEWEFAARGGAAVTAADFREPVYPTDGAPLPEHEAIGGPRSANGKVQPIGSLKPNPLGLHDMLGNVAELALEPFRLVRQGRLHGRVGGHVKRGADANTEESRATAAARQELRFLDPTSGEPVRDKYVGFRLVLSTIAIDGSATPEDYSLAQAAAAAPDRGVAAGEREAQALAALESAADIVDPTARRRALATIAASLDEARTERNDQRDRAVASLLYSTAYACSVAQQEVRLLAHFHRRHDQIAEILEKARSLELQGRLSPEEAAALPEAEEQVRLVKSRIADIEVRIDDHIAAYGNLIDTLRTDYGPDVTDEQARSLNARLDREGPRIIAACFRVANAHVDQARLTGRLDAARWRSDFETLRR